MKHENDAYSVWFANISCVNVAEVKYGDHISRLPYRTACLTRPNRRKKSPEVFFELSAFWSKEFPAFPGEPPGTQ